MKDRIEALIRQLLIKCSPWIQDLDGTIQFVDPLDHKEISAHYGASHFAVGLIIYGKEKGNQKLVHLGEKLLDSILDRWSVTMHLPGFHNDFNNFALCVLDEYDKDYHNRIIETVLSTPDSNHNTVNWLPMRWYVNNCRFKWTRETKYKNMCNTCNNMIKKATFNDGFIDDRLPIGTSFNLQYNIATVSILQFLRVGGEDIDIEKQVGALLNAVCPDGDINYLGRGTNQIFGWGLWVYLLSSGDLEMLGTALNYLEIRMPTMLNNNNIMLNSYPGEEKYMWWDYHYSSVYLAHLFLWLILAFKDRGKRKIIPRLVEDGSSGVRIIKNEKLFIALFDGRKEYISERGPSIAAVWTNNTGIVFKGIFGPWQGAFGRKYFDPDVTLKNYTGLMKIKMEKDWSQNRILKKLFQLNKRKAKMMVEPLFIMPKIEIGSAICLKYQVKGQYLLNIMGPTNAFTIIVDGIKKELKQIAILRNQYGWIPLNQILIEVNSEIAIIID